MHAPETVEPLAPDPIEVGAQVESLFARLEKEADPGVLGTVEEVVRLLVTLYGEALGHIVAALDEEGERGQAVLRGLVGDRLVAGLLVLHDLHPVDLETRVGQALETVRPYLGSHAGDVELVEVTEEAAVRLRLAGTCDGCPASSVTVTTAIETAIREVAPEVGEIVVDGMTSAPEPAQADDGRPLLQIQPRPPQDATLGPPQDMPMTPPSPDGAHPSASRGAGDDRGWVQVEVGSGGGPVEGRIGVLLATGARLAVTRVDGAVVAYRDACPGCGGSLDGAAVAAHVAACPGCGRRYDVHLAGRAVDGGSGLQPVPLLGGGAGNGDGTGAVRVAAGALAGGGR
ncbi:MAG: NifU family protein [Actinomycetes bacterium]